MNECLLPRWMVRRALVRALACILVTLAALPSTRAAVRGVYVGGEFYPPNSAVETAAKQSGFNRMFLFTMQIQANGDIRYNDTPVVTNGTYVGDKTWKSRLAAVKNDGRVTRIEACIGSYGSGSFDAIKNYVNSQGTGTNSILYRNFRALIDNTGVDAFQFDDEGTYDVNSSVAFGRMLAGMGVKVTLVPYTAQGYWVSVRNQLGSGIVDAIYLQCYDGGAGNDPGNWNNAFGNGVRVFPGLWGNTSSVSQTVSRMRGWQNTYGMEGGFMWLNGNLPVGGGAVQWGDALKLSLDPTPYFMLVNRSTGGCLDLIGGNTNPSAPINQWAYDYNGPNQRWAILPAEDGNHFKLLSWVSGFCACTHENSVSDGAQIDDYVYTGNSPAQQWDLLDAGNGFFKIRNVYSGKLLEVGGGSTANNAKVQQYADNGNLWQQFRLQPQGDYYVRAASGRYICVQGQRSDNTAPIIQYDGQANPWFRWRFEGVGDGNYKVSSLNALGRVLCVAGGSTANAASCHLYDYNANNAGDQKVRLKPLLNGKHKFYFVHDGMSWDIPSGNTANNVPLQQYPDNGNAWQQFNLERMP